MNKLALSESKMTFQNNGDLQRNKLIDIYSTDFFNA